MNQYSIAAISAQSATKTIATGPKTAVAPVFLLVKFKNAFLGQTSSRDSLRPYPFSLNVASSESRARNADVFAEASVDFPPKFLWQQSNFIKVLNALIKRWENWEVSP